jgi:hypothetical protein
MADFIWKYGLQIFGEESVRRSTVAGHRKRIVIIEYHVKSLEAY